MNISNEQRLCFSGGSVCGISYFGLLKSIVDRYATIPRQFNDFSGTSVGALIACLGYLMVDLNTIEYVKMSLTFTRLCANINITNVKSMLLARTYGVVSPQPLIDYFNALLKQLTNIDNPTFRQLHEYVTEKTSRRNNLLTICVTSINESKPLYFNVFRTPDVEIARVLYASMSIPFICEPIQLMYNNELHTCWDGLLMDNSPVLFEPYKSSIIVYCTNQNNFQPDVRFSTLLSKLLTGSSKHINRLNKQLAKHQSVDIKEIFIKTTISSMNFMLNDSDILELIAAGQKAGEFNFMKLFQRDSTLS